MAPEGATLRMGPGKESRIDFFVIDVQLAKAVKEIMPREEVTFHPHRPVVVKFSERPADLRYLTFDSPPNLPTSRFVGPRQQSERRLGSHLGELRGVCQRSAGRKRPQSGEQEPAEQHLR